MPFLTCDQLIAILEGQRCLRCKEKATWLPHDKGIGYCDEHFPYKQEKIEEMINLLIK